MSMDRTERLSSPAIVDGRKTQELRPMADPIQPLANGAEPGPDPEEGQPRGEGDFRGPYGYGRPAHKSDPNARYGFDTPLHPDKH
jgi:hypothetical protein